MGINWPKPGINHVGEYQASGHIFVQPAASQNKIVTLEFVAKSITFTNAHASNAETVLFYDSDGSTTVTFSIGASTTVKIDGKFLKFQLVGDNVSAFVELTNIPATDYDQPAFSTLATAANP